MGVKGWHTITDGSNFLAVVEPWYPFHSFCKYFPYEIVDLACPLGFWVVFLIKIYCTTKETKDSPFRECFNFPLQVKTKEWCPPRYINDNYTIWAGGSIIRREPPKAFVRKGDPFILQDLHLKRIGHLHGASATIDACHIALPHICLRIRAVTRELQRINYSWNVQWLKYGTSFGIPELDCLVGGGRD